MGHVLMSNKVPALTVPSTGIKAGDLAVGSSVYLMENGAAVEYLVVNQGIPSGSSLYDASCDGTWLLRKDIILFSVWEEDNVNKLESSDIHSWLKSTMLAKYDSETQNFIKQVKIPYRKNGGSGGSNQSGANGLSCKVFLLSGYEVGWTTSHDQYFPVDGAKLDYFEYGSGTSANNKRIAYYKGASDNWWLRSPGTSSTIYVWLVHSSGDYNDSNAKNSCGIRPALILPHNALFDKNTLILKGVA